MVNIKKILLYLSIICIMAMTCLFLWVPTENARLFVEKAINQAIHEQNIRVVLGKLEINNIMSFGVSNIKVFDKENEILDFQKLEICIAPSLIYKKIILSKLKIDNLTISNLPLTKSHIKNAPSNISIPSPNLLIKNLSIQKLNIMNRVSGLDEDLTLRVNGKLNYLAKEKMMEFNNIIKGSFAKEDLSLESFCIYDIEKKILDIKTFKINTDIGALEGILSYNRRQDSIISNIKYNLDISERLQKKNLSIENNSSSGEIDIKGQISDLNVNTKGNIKLGFKQSDHIKFPSILHEGFFYYNNGIVKGDFKIDQDNIISKGDILLHGNQLFLNNITINSPGFNGASNLSYNFKSKMLNGIIDLHDKTFETTSKFLPFLHMGKAIIKAHFFSKENKQALDIKIDSDNISSDSFSLNKLGFSASSSNLYNAQIDNMDLIISLLRIDDFILNKSKFSMKSKSNEIDIISNIESYNHYPIKLDLEASLSTANNIAKLSKVQLNIAESNQVSNVGDILINFNDGFKISPSKMLVNDGNFLFDGIWSNEGIYYNAAFNNISLNNSHYFSIPQLNNSYINGKIDLVANNSNINLISNVQIKDLCLGANDKIDMATKVNFNKNGSDIMVEFYKNKDRKGYIQANFENDFSIFPFNFAVKKNKNFNAELDIKTPLNLLSLMPNILDNQLSGLIQGNIKGSNNLEQPNVNGILQFQNASLSSDKLGINLQRMKGTITAKNSVINISDFIAQDIEQNQLDATGYINILDKYKFAMMVNTKKFKPIQRDLIDGEYSGTIKLSGDTEGANIQGDLRIGPCEIKIPNKFYNGIPTLNLVEAKESNNLQPNSYNIKLDMKAKTNSKVFVRGWGLNTEILGDITIKGDLLEPIVIGKLKSYHGRYEEFGKIFKVKEGVFTFDGPINPSPYLNIITSSDVDNTEIRLVLDGPILNPSLHIESSPEMPENRALSLLLFGKKLENISTFQAIQLANSLIKLSGKNNGFDPLGIGRKILKLDDIKIKSDSKNSGKSSIALGKYITDNVYLEVENGNYENPAKSKIEIELTPNISVENIIQQDGANRFILNYKHDY